jgi:hypothetical protein
MDWSSEIDSASVTEASVSAFLQAIFGQVPVDGSLQGSSRRNSCSQGDQIIMPETVSAEAVAYCEELMKQTKLSEYEVSSVEVVQAPRSYLAAIEGAVDKILARVSAKP